MGKLIVFEGPDGCGKTTQLELTAKVLESMGYTVKRTRHPGGTDTGKLLRAVIKDRTAMQEMPGLARRLVFTVDRLTHMRVLERELTEYDVVLMDRFDGVSNRSYGQAEGTDFEEIVFCEKIHQEHDVRPDLVLIFDVDPNEAWERTDHEDLADSDRTMFNHVNFEYSIMAAAAREYGTFNSLSGFTFVARAIDANQSIKDVQLQVAAEIGKVL